MTTTKTTWHVNGHATSSREGSMYWLRGVHCTMTFMSTRYGFLTPQTLYKPLPPPLKYPYPWKGYRFALGKGKGRCENTHGLPMPITRCDHMAITAKPMDPATLHGRALSIKGLYPGKHWHWCFIKWHPELKLGKASGLNPNQTNNFDEATMKHYFQLHQEVEEKYDGIPPEHQWNMDEKGIQLGGGQKNNGCKFIFTHCQKERYKIKSDNLKLVTIIECISAAGVAMPPSFVLKDGLKPDTQRLVDESVLR